MSDSAATIVQIATSGLNLGLASLLIYWFFSGKLHSNDEMAAVREQLKTTEAALERTREALMLSSARNETGLLSAEIIAQALGHRRERHGEDDDRRRERRGEDDDRRSRRRGEDDDRRSYRRGEDDGLPGLDHDGNSRERRYAVPPAQA